MTGRPSSFTQEIASAICERIMEGESLRQICRDENMPSRSAVHNWLAHDAVFMDQYAKACAVRADNLFDEMFDIADDATNDWMERSSGDGSVGWSLNGEHVQRSKLRIDTRKWALSKMMPKKYGDRVEVDNKHDISDPLADLLGAVANRSGRIGIGRDDD